MAARLLAVEIFQPLNVLADSTDWPQDSFWFSFKAKINDVPRLLIFGQRTFSVFNEKIKHALLGVVRDVRRGVVLDIFNPTILNLERDPYTIFRKTKEFKSRHAVAVESYKAFNQGKPTGFVILEQRSHIIYHHFLIVLFPFGHAFWKGIVTCYVIQKWRQCHEIRNGKCSHSKKRRIDSQHLIIQMIFELIDVQSP